MIQMNKPITVQYVPYDVVHYYVFPIVGQNVVEGKTHETVDVYARNMKVGMECEMAPRGMEMTICLEIEELDLDSDSDLDQEM